jgi:hypothetical protein
MTFSRKAAQDEERTRIRSQKCEATAKVASSSI